MAQFLMVLIPVANPVMRTAAERDAQGNHNLMRGRSIGDCEMDGQIMRAAAVIVLVDQRDHDRRIGPAARVAERQIGFRPHCRPVVIAKAQGVDQGRGVFNLAVQTHHGGFAITLNHFTRTGPLKDHCGQQPTQFRGHIADFRAKVVHKVPPGPRVADHRRRRDHQQGARGRLATLDQRCFNIGQSLADQRGHESLRGFHYLGIPYDGMSRVLAQPVTKG